MNLDEKLKTKVCNPINTMRGMNDVSNKKIKFIISPFKSFIRKPRPFRDGAIIS